MDRRSSLAVMLGKSTAASGRATTALPTGTLAPYNGPWTRYQAAHLLRRTTFGPRYDEITQSVDMGMDAIVDELLKDRPLPLPPINYNFQDDPYVPVGETWVDAAFDNIPGLQGSRKGSLRAWTFDLMLKDRLSIREKMTLFWHNHFVVAQTPDPRLEYIYINTLRQYALGNFRELTKAITIDPSMLIYLNGRENTNRAPNENYARELLELFTLGKGELAGPGDYTTFTEDDVIQIAKVLTGWRFRVTNNDQGKMDLNLFFNANLHDRSDKTLSHRFDNAVISNQGEQEYQALINVIFQRDEVATFIARKLYRYFIFYKIDEAIESNIIEPLAQIIRDNDYNIRPAMEVLLKSEHFYDAEHFGCMIKHPIDFYVSPIVQFRLDEQPDLQDNYLFLLTLSRATVPFDMEYYNHPSVAGWKAYYQAPIYYRHWISSVTLPLMVSYADVLTRDNVRFGRALFIIDPLSLIEELPNPSDPNDLISDLTDWLLTNPVPQEQKDYLKEVLIPGLPDFEWTVEYNKYLADPTNTVIKGAVQVKLLDLFRAILKMPEFYLS